MIVISQMSTLTVQIKSKITNSENKKSDIKVVYIIKVYLCIPDVH